MDMNNFRYYYNVKISAILFPSFVRTNFFPSVNVDRWFSFF